MLIEGECEGLGPTRAARKFGFSKQRYFQLRAAFAELGAASLQSRKRGPKTHYRRTAEVVRQVIRHRFLDPDASAEVIAQKLSQSGWTISIRSVQRVFEEFGLQKKTVLHGLAGSTSNCSRSLYPERRRPNGLLYDRECQGAREHRFAYGRTVADRTGVAETPLKQGLTSHWMASTALRFEPRQSPEIREEPKNNRAKKQQRTRSLALAALMVLYLGLIFGDRHGIALVAYDGLQGGEAVDTGADFDVPAGELAGVFVAGGVGEGEQLLAEALHEPSQAYGLVVDVQAGLEPAVLCGDAGGTMIGVAPLGLDAPDRSEEHTSELQSH